MTILTDEEIRKLCIDWPGNVEKAIRETEAKILEKLNSQEPVAWQIRNGVCHAGIRSNKNDAESVAANMQKCADLGGSLCYYHVRPLYTHSIPQDSALQSIIEKVEKLTIERCANDIESFANLAFNTGYKIARLDCAAVIRALPTQIKLEEL